MEEILSQLTKSDPEISHHITYTRIPWLMVEAMHIYGEKESPYHIKALALTIQKDKSRGFNVDPDWEYMRREIDYNLMKIMLLQNLVNTKKRYFPQKKNYQRLKSLVRQYLSANDKKRLPITSHCFESINPKLNISSHALAARYQDLLLKKH